MTIPEKYAHLSILRLPQVAEMLNIDPKIVIEAVQAGELLAMNFGRGSKLSLRFESGDLIRWIKSKRMTC